MSASSLDVFPRFGPESSAVQAGPQSAKILERLLAAPESFMENAELEEADWHPPKPGQWTSLGRDVRLSLAVACLKSSLAQQSQRLGSN